MDRLGRPWPRKIALFSARPWGELLCLIPALRALRRALPRAHLVWVGSPWAQPFVERFSGYLDEFIEFPGCPGLPQRIPHLQEIPVFLEKMQSRRFDLAIQCHGSEALINSLVVMFGARLNAGFYRLQEYCPDAIRFRVFPENASDVQRWLSLMQWLGIPSQGDDIEFPIFEKDFQLLQGMPELEEAKPGRYVCVHPGGLFQRWALERFAGVGDWLAGQGLRVFLTGAPEDKPLTDGIRLRMRAPCQDLSGRLALGTFGALLSGARLLVCNDAGVANLARALDVPQVSAGDLNPFPTDWTHGSNAA